MSASWSGQSFLETVAGPLEQFPPVRVLFLAHCVLANGRLTLHRGMLRRLELPVDQIASIDPLPSFANDWRKNEYVKGALRLDVAGGTVLELRLHSPARPIGVLGEGAAGSRVLVGVDDPAPLIAAITCRTSPATP